MDDVKLLVISCLNKMADFHRQTLYGIVHNLKSLLTSKGGQYFSFHPAANEVSDLAGALGADPVIPIFPPNTEINLKKSL